MATLYKNIKGYDITRHSYSAGQTFRGCRRRYKLEKIIGWKEKSHNAAMEFGNCVEASVQYYHGVNSQISGSGIDEFKRLWLQIKSNTTLTYKDKEGDWDDFYQIGSEMLALYEATWQKFGYRNPKFQKSYRKEVFPGTELAGLEFIAYVDMLVELEPDRLGIVDMKVSGGGIDADLVSLDPQLRSYAWVSGIPDTAFLWFERKKPGSFRRGDEVTMLTRKFAHVEPGDRFVFLSAIEDKAPNECWILTPKLHEEFERSAKGLKGKALDAKISEWEHKAFAVRKADITKQRITFAPAGISKEIQEQAGRLIGQEIADIHAATLKDDFPQDSGVRWPNDRCKFCPMLGICLDKPDLIEKNLVSPQTLLTNSTPNDIEEKNWIDEI